MEFLKKHYEKVLLGVVLLGLAVAVGFLPFKIASEKQKLDDLRQQFHPNVKPLTNLDLSMYEGLLKRVTVPEEVDLSAPNRLFNPMVWQKAADGHLIKVDATNIGPNALVITNRKALDTVLTLDDVTVTDSGTRFRIGVKKEASLNPREWSKTQKYCKVGDKNDTFTVRDAKAAADSPTDVTVTLELNDTGQLVKITKDKGFTRTDGYTVDLRYPPENTTFPSNRRVGSKLVFNGETYKIVAISTNEVVLLAESNQKKTTVRYEVAPAPPPH
ncbi:MAG TPA: hypothetical protein VMU04_19400 [Candidatus Acidoferrum sp.]|nr:hypothetical protein [Candidatus Acidoferrum sp.]